MKKDYTEFKCDNCGKTETILSETEFPYKYGWTYLYKFEYKTQKSQNKEQKLKDQHFCSASCMYNFLQKKLISEKI